MREKLPVLLCQPTDTTIRNISYCPADKIKYDQIREALTWKTNALYEFQSLLESRTFRGILKPRTSTPSITEALKPLTFNLLKNA